MGVLVIIPAYNEARNLPRVIARLRASAPTCDVCVVDDGSTDETAQTAAGLGVTVLRLPTNLGIGGAVQTGYLWAQRRGYDVAIQLDGDGQHDPAFVARLVQPIEAGEADLVVGSRFLQGEGFQSTRLRRLGIRYLSWLLRLRCGVEVRDVTSGFRAAGKQAIALFARNYPADYPEPEALAQVKRAGLKILELPVTMEARQHGTSSIDLGRTLYYLVKVSLALLLLPERLQPALPSSTEP